MRRNDFKAVSNLFRLAVVILPKVAYPGRYAVAYGAGTGDRPGRRSFAEPVGDPRLRCGLLCAHDRCVRFAGGDVQRDYGAGDEKRRTAGGAAAGMDQPCVGSDDFPYRVCDDESWSAERVTEERRK